MLRRILHRFESRIPAAADLRVISARGVFNIFGGRNVAPTNAAFTSLLDIGFGVDASGDIVLERPAELSDYATKLRSGQASIPDSWGPKMRASLGRVLQKNKPNVDVVDDVTKLMAWLKDDRRRVNRAAVGMVGGDAATILSAAEDAAELDRMVCNEDQRQAIELAKRGVNMYLGGQAGTGKTITVRKIVRALTELGLKVAVTASTGLAACHINGRTFHYQFGVTKLGDFSNVSEFTAFDVIIIDEVSMLSKQMLQAFDEKLRNARCQPHLPFGGCQIILTGDFLQLGVISKGQKGQVLHKLLPVYEWDAFHTNFVHGKLVQQVRQSDDPTFSNILNEMRRGIVSPALKDHVSLLTSDEAMAPKTTVLLPKNEQVREANNEKLAALDGVSHSFDPYRMSSVVEGRWSPTALFRSQVGSPSEISAHVHEAWHRDPSNPQVTVCCYRSYDDIFALRLSMPRLDDEVAEKEISNKFNTLVSNLGTIANVPCSILRVVPTADEACPFEVESALEANIASHAWAQTLQLKVGAEVMLRKNLSSTLVNGSIGVVTHLAPLAQAADYKYCRTMDDELKGDLDSYYNYLKYSCGIDSPTIPIVQFAGTKEPVAVAPVREFVGGTSATHYFALPTLCYPLSLAYAFTVHKVQGLTLMNSVRVDMRQMWKCNHLIYVAASRVRKASQLSFVGFKEDLVVVDKKAVEFDKSLPPIREATVPATAKVASWATSATPSFPATSTVSQRRSAPSVPPTLLASKPRGKSKMAPSAPKTHTQQS